MEKKITTAGKEVILRIREGYFLYENRVTPGARWSLGKNKGNYRWGSVNGNIIDKLLKLELLTGQIEHTACYIYTLTELGKTIEL